jgi:hypothetical protein
MLKHSLRFFPCAYNEAPVSLIDRRIVFRASGADFANRLAGFSARFVESLSLRTAHAKGWDVVQKC